MYPVRPDGAEQNAVFDAMGRSCARSVLVVDGEPAVAQLLGSTLEAHGYQIFAAGDEANALTMIGLLSPDVVVQNLGAPRLDHVGALHRLRSVTAAPIIVLSTRAAFTDTIEALDAGADDYLITPFNMAELAARVRAVARRPTAPPSVVISPPDLTVNVADRRVLRAGRPVRLTPHEWDLLKILVRHAGQLVTGRQLLTEVWGRDKAHETHYLRVYVAQLRRKIEPDPAHPRYIITEHGVGYRFQTGFRLDLDHQ